MLPPKINIPESSIQTDKMDDKEFEDSSNKIKIIMVTKKEVENS